MKSANRTFLFETDVIETSLDSIGSVITVMKPVCFYHYDVESLLTIKNVHNAK